jgi:D-3-phosphoglycerate dehydrogenase
MKVLIADKLPPSASKRLSEAGCEVIFEPSLKGAALCERLNQTMAEVLVVRSTKVGADAMAAAPKLGLVVRAGAGTNTIDVAEAAARGIYVANCPGRNANAVAELAFGLILAADRQIPNNVRDIRAGKWRKKHYGNARGLYGRTLGLIGLGNIGKAMLPRAAAFGMPVVAWSRSLTPESAAALGVEWAADPRAVAAKSDVVSVHVALSPQTRGFVSKDVFAAMRPGATFINTSRGEVVDEAALLNAVETRELRCGLDVYCDEPPAAGETFATPLARHELFFGTHHIGASTLQAQEAVAQEAARIVISFLSEGVVPNCVNLCSQSPSTHMLVVRHRDEVGVLAGVFDVLRNASINVQEMENIIFAGAHAAVARIRLESGPNSETIQRIKAAQHVLAVDLLPLSQ